MNLWNLDLQIVLNIISTVAIVIALVFGAVQVRQANRSRAEQAAISVIQSSQGDSWTRALDSIARLPAGGTVEQILQLGPEAPKAIFDFGARLETIGYMTYLRLVPLSMIEDLIGGIVLGFWSRASSWIEAERTRTGNPKLFEWCQWLVERLSERRAQLGDQPAHIKHRAWR